MRESTNLGTLGTLITDFQNELSRIHREMDDAEVIAGKLGIQVPWKRGPGKAPGYRVHKRSREDFAGVLSTYSMGQPFSVDNFLTRINELPPAEGFPYTRNAISTMLNRGVDAGTLRKVRTGVYQREPIR